MSHCYVLLEDSMIFETLGDKTKPSVLFFHAMGVVGQSSFPVAKYLADEYFCIMPTATCYCKGQHYVSKADEVSQVESFLRENNITSLKLVVSSSIGADLASAFLAQTKRPVEYAFFDGGQFAQIPKSLRRIMVPFLFFAIKSLYWSKGKTLGKILWCSDENIKPYFIEAGKNLTYNNLRRQMKDSLEDKPFPFMTQEMQKHSYFEFGSVEEHMKYRDAVMKAYPYANFPVFDGYNHMQKQIRDPEGFALMLKSIMTGNGMPK